MCDLLSQNGLPGSAMFGRADYIGARYVADAHPAFTDKVSKVPQVSAKEAFYANDLVAYC